MFEKEAEEYTNKLLEDWELYDPEALQEAYIAGAEFGYNKVNEWHDLKKDSNDLPKDNDEKLCFYEKGKVVARYDSEYNCWETYFNNFKTVIPSSVIIAWKEIVLPELPKGGIKQC